MMQWKLFNYVIGFIFSYIPDDKMKSQESNKKKISEIIICQMGKATRAVIDAAPSFLRTVITYGPCF